MVYCRNFLIIAKLFLPTNIQIYHASYLLLCIKCLFFSIKSRKRSCSISSENVCILKKTVVFTKRVCPLWNVSKDKNVKDWENVKVIGHQMWTLFAYFPEAYIDIIQCLFKETIPYFWSGSSQIWKGQTTYLALSICSKNLLCYLFMFKYIRILMQFNLNSV